jgi:hypothetical protein
MWRRVLDLGRATDLVLQAGEEITSTDGFALKFLRTHG